MGEWGSGEGWREDGVTLWGGHCQGHPGCREGSLETHRRPSLNFVPVTCVSVMLAGSVLDARMEGRCAGDPGAGDNEMREQRHHGWAGCHHNAPSTVHPLRMRRVCKASFLAACCFFLLIWSRVNSLMLLLVQALRTEGKRSGVPPPPNTPFTCKLC